MPTINYWAVLVAGLVGLFSGGIWYSKHVFGTAWQKASGVVCSDNKGHSAKVFGFSIIFSLIAAYALAVLLGPAPDFMRALITSIVIGVCFVTTSFGINYLFANRGWTLLLIDGGYHILQFALYGIILGLWH